ncbi:MAG TPA: PorP/SprF family type IX secretion system membrane protein [Saprospiraceae bacterium]|nr:PorP/SprF family type IX secretion system membrane protein [Saprospiraceae bacterium]
MRIRFLILLFFYSLLQVNGQQLPDWSGFYEVAFTHNPALTARWSRAETSIIHRMDYSGIQGAPQTTTLSFQLPFIRPVTQSGIGAFLTHDEVGPAKTYTFQATYNYRIRPQLFGYSNDCLAFGLGAGIKSFQFNPNNEIAFDGLAVDPNLIPQKANFNPDISMGIFYSTTRDLYEFESHYYFGIAMHKFIPVSDDLGVLGKLSNNTQVMIHGGYRILPFRSTYYIEPQLFLSYGWYKTVHAMAACRVEWENLLWLGAGIGSNRNYYGQIGFIFDGQSKLKFLVSDGALRLGLKVNNYGNYFGKFTGLGGELYAAYTFDMDLYQ